MAISPSLPGVKVSVTINHRTLPEQEYAELESEPRTIDRLIEAESEQIFEVRLYVDPSVEFKGTDLSFNVYVDGRYADGNLVSSERMSETDRGFTARSRGCYVSRSMLRKFMFTSLDVVDRASHSVSSRTPSMPAVSRPSSDRVESNSVSFRPQHYSPAVNEAQFLNASELEELGTIKVEVSHVNRKEAVPFTAPRILGRRRNEDEKNVKAEKAKMSIGFAAAEHVAPISVYDAKDVEGVDCPAATYIFHYRSAQMLKTMGIDIKQEEPPLPCRLATLEERRLSQTSTGPPSSYDNLSIDDDSIVIRKGDPMARRGAYAPGEAPRRTAMPNPSDCSLPPPRPMSASSTEVVPGAQARPRGRGPVLPPSGMHPFVMSPSPRPLSASMLPDPRRKTEIKDEEMEDWEIVSEGAVPKSKSDPKDDVFSPKKEG